MFEFLSRFFRPQGSSTIAKDRLRLVLLSDHLQLAPDVVEALKSDLIGVISKYVEVDVESCEVTFEQQDHSVAMLANIPIVSMKVRTLETPVATAVPEPEPIVLGEPVLEVQPQAAPTPVTATSHAHAAAPRSRRRRRKRAGQQTATGPAT